jgi:hypothetical protein
MAVIFANATDDILDTLAHELEKLQPDEETLLRCNYARIHSAVAAAMGRGNTMRQILDLLKLKGLDLHHAQFTKLYKAELKVRNAHGERVCCVMCGQHLKPKDKAYADEADALGTGEKAAA